MDTLGIFCLVISFLHCTEAKCSERLVKYWEKQYRRNYFGDLDPWRRCKSENGYCMREKDICNSNDWVRYQTKCDDKCECCFREERIRAEIDWVLVMKRLNWTEAREDCRTEKNGDLVVPENIGDLIKFMQRNDIGSADVWVGINDKFNGRFEGIYGNEVLGGWLQGHPRRQTSDRENCIVVEDASFTRDEVGMKVEPCWATNYYVCDVNRNNRNRHDVYLSEDDKPKKKEIEEDNDTEITFGDHIKIYADRKTWRNARDDCQEKGGDLLIPRSIDDLVHFMQRIEIGERDIWIGFSDHHHDEHYEGIHGNQIHDESVWQRGQPYTLEPGDDCVVVEDDFIKGAGLKVNPCHRTHLYACDLSEHYRDPHPIGH